MAGVYAQRRIDRRYTPSTYIHSLGATDASHEPTRTLDMGRNLHLGNNHTDMNERGYEHEHEHEHEPSPAQVKHNK